jgi:DNA (cytosine-5)-methyltransferase 1
LIFFRASAGFSLGLERAKCENGPYNGFETVAFCEIEEFPRKVLAKHWPNVPCYDDVRQLSTDALVRDGTRVDVITGGFPCQDISVAGNQAGLGDGTRSGLWSECLRLVGELRPRFALFENVANLLAGPADRPGAWFSQILADLASLGYDAEWENIPAAAVGAPHLRERVWLMAYPAEVRTAGQFLVPHNQQGYAEFEARTSMLPPYSHGMVTAASDYTLRAGDGFPGFLGQLNGYGNAVVPQIPELIGNAILRSIS